MNLSEAGYALRSAKARLLMKRTFDIVVSSAVLLAMAPLMLAIAVLVKLTSKGPAIFRHSRVGLSGKEFFVYKFRTMQVGAEQMKADFSEEQQAEFKAAFKLRNDPRITKFGNVLRKTSLDELPQFINVLRGQMSVVGPRPVTREELEKYGAYRDVLLSVNPGITGLWQISGRNDVSYRDRILLDVKYVESRSFLNDLKIFFITFRIVAARIGVY